MHGLLTLSALAALIGGTAEDDILFRETFNNELHTDWKWIRENPDDWRLNNEGGLDMRLRPGDAQSVQNALLLSVPEHDGPLAFAVTVVLPKPFTEQYEQAGLTWYADGEPVFKIVHERIDGEQVIIPGRVPTESNIVRLRVVIQETGAFTAQFREEGKAEFHTTAEGELALGDENHISIQGYHGPAEGGPWIGFRDFTISKADGD